MAAQHLAIRPGTDAALANGILHVLIRDNLIDPAFIRELMEHGEARAGEFLDALAFERACLSRDLDAALDLVDDDVAFVSRPPFPAAGPTRGAEHVRRFLREHLGGGLAIDLTRKQVAGRQVTWTARADASSVLGTVRAELRDGLIRSLELGGPES